MRTLVTGSSGFVGRAVVRHLIESQQQVVVSQRTASQTAPPSGVSAVQVGDLAGDTDWQEAVAGVTTVVHLAARVHVMRDRAEDPLAEFRRANVEGTLALARQAAAAGVSRFVFVSSIKVNGEATVNGQRFRADDTPSPHDPYGISKFEAEEGLRAIAAQSGMQTVVIRPPLVYGPGVKANFLSMMRWLFKGVPLPLGAIDNRRSLVALDNLADLIVTCVRHPAAGNQTFLAGDGDDLSTTQLLQRLGRALGRPARLVPVPPAVLRAGAALLGKSDVAQRLLSSLQVDASKAGALLGWKPPITVDEGLRRVAHWFVTTQG